MSRDTHDLDERVCQFGHMGLPGQPMMMHMGTHRLVQDLHTELKRVQSQVVELESKNVRDILLASAEILDDLQRGMEKGTGLGKKMARIRIATRAQDLRDRAASVPNLALRQAADEAE